jgi:hypothetical protein
VMPVTRLADIFAPYLYELCFTNVSSPPRLQYTNAALKKTIHMFLRLRKHV